MSATTFVVSAVVGLILAVLAFLAARCNYKRWSSERKQPFVPESEQLLNLPEDWRYKEHHWPRPRKTPGDAVQGAKWATYARLARNRSREQRVRSEGILVIAGAYIGFQIEPAWEAIWAYMNRDRSELTSAPYLEADFWGTLFPIVPALFFMQWALLSLSSAQKLETVQQEYNNAAVWAAEDRHAVVPEGSQPESEQTVRSILSDTLQSLRANRRQRRGDPKRARSTSARRGGDRSRVH